MTRSTAQTIPDEAAAQIDAAMARRREAASPPRVLRGLRVPVLPSGPLLAQCLGAGALTAGMFLQFGAAVTLIVAGAAGAVLGALKEAGRI